MALIAYWTASLRKVRKIPVSHLILTIIKDVPDITTDLKNLCNQCKSWKPERTHHCSYCGQCVPKMDHHCPWVGNCVGYHNLKPFYLFCFYQACSGVVYFAMLWHRCFKAPRKLEPFSVLGATGYWVTNILDMPICFSLLGLSTNIFI